MTRLEQLRDELQQLDRVSSEEWLSNLEERKRKELEFHDKNRDRQSSESLDSDTYERFYGNKKYYVATASSRSYVNEWIRTEASERVFLDYACGNGEQAINAAKAGAALAIGIDISPVSIENARQDAKKAGVEKNTFFVQADAEDTRLPAGSVDRVLCSGMLHHLDLSYAFPELRRILSDDGKMLAVEALDYNPLIKLYRYMTPEMRTEWEKSHILSLKDVRFARRFFDTGEIRYWHISSIAGGKFPSLLPLLNAMDSVFSRLPAVRLMAWLFTFELIKRPESKSR